MSPNFQKDFFILLAEVLLNIFIVPSGFASYSNFLFYFIKGRECSNLLSVTNLYIKMLCLHGWVPRPPFLKKCPIRAFLSLFWGGLIEAWETRRGAEPWKMDSVIKGKSCIHTCHQCKDCQASWEFHWHFLFSVFWKKHWKQFFQLEQKNNQNKCRCD